MKMGYAIDIGGAQNVTQINNSADIVNPIKYEKRDISVADTVTTPPETSLPSSLFHFQVPSGWGGMWLHTFSLVYNNAFQTGYSYVMLVSGVTDDNSNYQLPDPTALTFDYVPIGTRIKLPAGANLDIYAYNSTGATSAGIFSANIIGDLIPPQ